MSLLMEVPLNTSMEIYRFNFLPFAGVGGEDEGGSGISLTSVLAGGGGMFIKYSLHASSQPPLSF